MFIQFIRFYKYTIATTIVIIVLSLFNTEEVQLPEIHFFDHIDKLFHFAMYAFLTFVFLWENYVRHKYHLLVNRLFIIAAIVITLGISLEITQAYLTQTRSGDIMDELANFGGSIGGFALFHISKYNTFLKASVFKESAQR